MENEKIIVMINGDSVEKEVVKRPDGFDPMTGEQVFASFVANGFDPMTGEQVYSKVVRDGFDPMTGEPVYTVEGAQSKAAPTKATNSRGKSGNKLSPLVIGIIAAVAVVIVFAAVAVFAGLKSGAFLNKHDKIALAAYNTVKDDTIGKVIIDAAEIISSDEITTTLDGSFKYSGISVSGSGKIGVDRKNVKVGGEMELYTLGMGMTPQFYADSTKVQLTVPEIDDEVFEYNFTKEGNGYIYELLMKEGVDLNEVNSYVSRYAEMIKKSPKYASELKKEGFKAYHKMEVNKIKSSNFEIDGKTRKCRGYEMVIDKDTLKDFIDAYLNAIDSVYGEEYYQLMEDMGIKENIYDELKSELITFKPVKVKVYLYKGKLAAISTVFDGERISVEFRGGYNRCANMRIAIGDDMIIRKSILKNNKETSYFDMGNDQFMYSYNVKTGEAEIGLGILTFDGIFNVVPGKYVDVSFGESIAGVSVSAGAVISKGSSIKEVKGTKFDVANASEIEVQRLLLDIESTIGDVIKKLL